MKLHEKINSRFGIALGFFLSRLPPSVGYRVAKWAADVISSKKNTPGVMAVRANQWIIHDQKLSTGELDHLVRETYRNSARALYEYWHYLPDKKSAMEMVAFDPSFFNSINMAKAEGNGLILAISHLGNFDLVGQAAVANGVKLHALSYPQPPGAYRMQNSLRQLEGMVVTPLSIGALRLASQTLSSGGIVTTGIDRPLVSEGEKYRVRFFERKASLPVLHVRLAIKHNTPVSVVGNYKGADNKYHVWASDLVRMKPKDDIVREIVYNAEMILDIAADDIRRAPDQWAMFYPIWPEVLNREPA